MQENTTTENIDVNISVNCVMQKFWFTPERISTWKSPNVHQVPHYMFNVSKKSRGGFITESNNTRGAYNTSYFDSDNWRQRADDIDDAFRRQD